VGGELSFSAQDKNAHSSLPAPHCLALPASRELDSIRFTSRSAQRSQASSFITMLELIEWRNSDNSSPTRRLRLKLKTENDSLRCVLSLSSRGSRLPSVMAIPVLVPLQGRAIVARSVTKKKVSEHLASPSSSPRHRFDVSFAFRSISEKKTFFHLTVLGDIFRLLAVGSSLQKVKSSFFFQLNWTRDSRACLNFP
jgi:hypothetical protein